MITKITTYQCDGCENEKDSKKDKGELTDYWRAITLFVKEMGQEEQSFLSHACKNKCIEKVIKDLIANNTSLNRATSITIEELGDLD